MRRKTTAAFNSDTLLDWICGRRLRIDLGLDVPNPPRRLAVAPDGDLIRASTRRRVGRATSHPKKRFESIFVEGLPQPELALSRIIDRKKPRRISQGPESTVGPKALGISGLGPTSEYSDVKSERTASPHPERRQGVSPDPPEAGSGGTSTRPRSRGAAVTGCESFSEL